MRVVVFSSSFFPAYIVRFVLFVVFLFCKRLLRVGCYLSFLCSSFFVQCSVLFVVCRFVVLCLIVVRGLLFVVRR